MHDAHQLRLDDGFSTIITLSNIPTVKIFEKSVTPPGVSAGGAIDTTTMRNIAWRTNAPRALKTATPISATVAFATEAIPQIHAQIGVLQEFTVTFPDGSTITQWGWLEEFSPAEFVEGEQPTATITVQPSNRDDQGEEQAPVWAEHELSS